MPRSLLAAVRGLAAGVACSLLALPAAAQMLFPDLAGTPLRAALRAAYTPARVLGYGPARDSLFAREMRTRGELCGAYSGFCVALTPGADPSADADARGINTEHTWPQSRGAAREPALSDLHHLVPARAVVNTARGNLPLAQVPAPQATAWYRGALAQSAPPPADEHGLWSRRGRGGPDAALRFEPRDAHKGDAARALFYVATVYEPEVDAAAARAFLAAHLADLLAWHAADPPDAPEADRSAWIAQLQGTPNPFLLDPTLAPRAFGDYLDAPPPAPPPALWVNELHYDNAGADAGEFVEVAGRAGTPLDGVRLVLYNGADGRPYATRTLAGALPDEGAGAGAVAVAVADLQNGAPDGLALVAPDGAVLEFLSYEGTFAATDGPAAGLTATDIGVGQPPSTPPGLTLQRTGAGTRGADFSWTGPAPHSPGALNAGQSVPDALARAALPGPEGWHQLALPGGGTLADLTAGLWTQGVPDAQDPRGQPSVLVYDKTAGAFHPPGALADALDAGQGAFVYVYTDDDPDAPGLQGGFPKPLAAVAPPATLPFSFPGLSATGTPAPDAGWALLGNPTDGPLAWDAPGWTRADLSGAAYTYSPATASYLVRAAGIGSLPDGLLPPFAGFWVQTTGPHPALVAPAGAGFLEGARADAPTLELRLDAPGGLSAAAFVALHRDARRDLDPGDALALVPPAERFVLAWTALVEPPRTPLAVQALPDGDAYTLALGLDAAGDAPVAARLSWPRLPPDLDATLHDALTGTTTRLDPGGALELTLAPRVAPRAAHRTTPHAPPAPERLASTADRFTLALTPRSTATGAPARPPARLGPPQPNPARTAARLPLRLAVPADVRAAVVDALGRTVLALADGPHASGEHALEVDTRLLAPGVYRVVVSAGAVTLSHPLAVVR